MPKKINSRAKGVKGEHEVRDIFRERGFVAKRGQQHEGGSDSPDVMHPIPWLHVEVKRTESLQLYKAMEQAAADMNEGQVPTVWHRRNKKDWVVIMNADDFMDLVEGLDWEVI
jgi:Holliday junction resolvase